ncbi:alpha/beta hydrolase [Actinorhabdospora filicis]|uniref:alpha/beta hydrolase n=1 Tax=Actinorhabdospora filicis TaxID=1785913 RepID=UPI0025568F9F|nr:alpha/beta hydrolase [Actinorhabdospora filicis]
MTTWRAQVEARLRQAVLVALAAVVVVGVPSIVYPLTTPVSAEPGAAPLPPAETPDALVAAVAPGLAGLTASAAATRVALDPRLVVAAAGRDPASYDDPVAEALTRLAGQDPAVVRAFFAGLPAAVTEWAAVLFPSAIGNLEGAPYPARIAANRLRLTAETVRPSTPDVPMWTPPWALAGTPYADFFAGAADRGHDLIYFDPVANNGQGSWAEVIGDLTSATRVGILVPGGSASVVSDNFIRYALRARSFVDAPEAAGKLAVIVWAGADFPSGWLQEGLAGYAEKAAPRLASFSRDLRARLAPGVPVIAIGHSYGGPVVGLAETRGLDADVILQLASAGSGHGVTDVHQYDAPCRTRYSMTAPADLIGYVQGSGDAPGIGHGLDPDEMPGTILLDSGFHVADPNAPDDIGRPIGALAGTEIRGIHAHSEVFNPRSDAWVNILAVLTGGAVVLKPGGQPPAVEGC